MARAIRDKKMKMGSWLFIFKEYLEAKEIVALVLICYCIERQSMQYVEMRNVWFILGKNTDNLFL